MSTRGLKRVFEHVEPTALTGRTHTAHWLKALSCNGYKPDFVVLESQFTTDQELSAAEDKWIRLLRTTGSRLTNRKSGGFNGVPDLETRQKMSLARKGKPLSIAHRQAIGKALTGTERTDQTRRNMAVAKIGLFNPAFGKKQTPEHIAKRVLLGEKNPMFGKQPSPATEATRFKPGHGKGVAKTLEQRAKLSGYNHWTKKLGRGHSDETRRKIGEAGKGRVPPNKGKPNSDETRAKIAIAVKANIAINGHKPVCGSCRQPGHYKTTCPSLMENK